MLSDDAHNVVDGDFVVLVVATLDFPPGIPIGNRPW